MDLRGSARILWLIAGSLSLACGLIGAVLPVVPTVPFMLLAAFCFARSSPWLEHWLETHPTFGPPIANWRRYRAISVRAKIYSVGAMTVSPFVTWYIGAPLWALIAQIAILVAVAIFILSRPSV